uniref:ATP synthase F0 subunit 8 n=1 Tax=Mileewa sharpa TaxID=2984023 RepID=A0A977XTA1_9HEMI|nr:ATP synthase F0 subunit 8 [Mileewa sharpa]UXX17556.1 ATP synthase F0 subunit 8 [Mileewa sharpa]
MPQMSPLWWLTMMFFFLMAYMLVNVIFYFNLISFKTNKKNLNFYNKFWKW